MVFDKAYTNVRPRWIYLSVGCSSPFTTECGLNGWGLGRFIFQGPPKILRREMIGAHDVSVLGLSDKNWEGNRRRLVGGEWKTWRHRGFWHIRRPMGPRLGSSWSDIPL